MGGHTTRTLAIRMEAVERRLSLLENGAEDGGPQQDASPVAVDPEKGPEASPSGTGSFSPKHRGFGKWGVVDDGGNLVIEGPLTKDEAQLAAASLVSCDVPGDITMGGPAVDPEPEPEPEPEPIADAPASKSDPITDAAKAAGLI